MTSQQFWVLVAIRSLPGPALTELAERQRLDQPTASRLVQALIRRRFVRMETDPEDARRVRLWLTPTGEKLGAEFAALADEIRDAVVEGMTQAEQNALRVGLRKIISNMERLERGGGKRTAR